MPRVLAVCVLLATVVTLVAPANVNSRASVESAEARASTIVSFGESETCASINTNASLNGTYLSIYYVAGGASNNSSTSNQTPPTPRMGYPNVTVGEAQLHTAWVSICSSGEYTGLYERLIINQSGAAGFTAGGELNGSTTHFEADYGFVYYASCSNAGDFRSRGCEFFTTWHVDLATGGVTGPFTAVAGTPLGGSPGPRPGSPGRVETGLPPILGLPGSVGYAVVAAIVTAGLGLLAVSARVRSRAARPSDALETGPPRPAGSEGETPPRSAGSLEAASVGGASIETDADPLKDVY